MDTATRTITATRSDGVVTVHVDGTEVFSQRSRGTHAVVVPYGDWVAGAFRQRRNLWVAEFSASADLAHKRASIMRRRCRGILNGIYGDSTIIEVR